MTKMVSAVAMCTAVVTLSIVGCRQQDRERELNISCVQHFQMPKYPPLAHSARVTGDVSVVFTVGHAGEAADIALVDATSPLIMTTADAGLKGVIREWRFLPECAGTRMRIPFRLRIDDSAVATAFYDSPGVFTLVEHSPRVPISDR